MYNIQCTPWATEMWSAKLVLLRHGHLITTTNISQSSSLDIQSYLCNIIFLRPGKQTNVSVKTFNET